LLRYALRRATLACRPSRLRLRRRWSTEMPMVGASFTEMPASWGTRGVGGEGGRAGNERTREIGA
jgi:hypothetical protein